MRIVGLVYEGMKNPDTDEVDVEVEMTDEERAAADDHARDWLKDRFPEPDWDAVLAEPDIPLPGGADDILKLLG